MSLPTSETQEFAQKIKDITLDPKETIVSYDFTSLFISVSTTEAFLAVRKQLLQDITLEFRTNFIPDHICALLDLCLSTTYFLFRERKYKWKHGCTMGSPLSPIVANLYMEEVKRKALTSLKGAVPSLWFRYVDYTWDKKI